jgi:hypothetical protein
MLKPSPPKTPCKGLQRIPGIGPRLAVMLVEVGINKVDDLRGCSPERLYEKLNASHGKREDPCVLYAFRCAVYFATEPKPEPQLLKWWNWKDAAAAPEIQRRRL